VDGYAFVVPADLARYIDHTLLDPCATAADVRRLCDEARRYGFAAVCVASSRVALARGCLRGSAVKVAAVVGFPHGNGLPEAKACEARAAVRLGADEIDMVLNLGALKDGDWESVHDDIRGVVEAAGVPVKVILEAGALTQEEKIAAAAIARISGAAFVKTSTGFGPGGATLADVRLLRRAAGALGVKASGGIRSAREARVLLDAGADRLGTSAGVAMVAEP
jgi:deoxyribose-phosphate aldolase